MQQYILLLLEHISLSETLELPWNCGNGFPVNCCEAAKYFMLPSIIQTYLGLHVECPKLLSNFNHIWIYGLIESSQY